MDYKKHYNNLISSRKQLGRNKKNGTFEKHHIVPKCFGGSNKPENIVLLTPREHYIAHLLLVELYTGKEKAKMCFALFQMCRANDKHNRIVSSKQYEAAKKLMSENCKGENAAFYGKKLSEENKKKLSERMKGDSNPSRKFPVWNKGLKNTTKHSEEHKQKMRQLHLGKPKSLESRIKMSVAAKGKSKTEEHKKKLSEANKGKKLDPKILEKLIEINKNRIQQTFECPHCKLIGKGSTMYRWHFNNCKLKSS